MKKYTFAIVFALMLVGILLFQFSVSYDFRIKPPSEEWSKEVLLSGSNGVVKSYPKMLKTSDGNYIIANQDGENIKILIMDSMGKKVKDMEVPVGDEFIKCINLLRNDSFYYLNWITSQNGTKYMTSVKINENLKVLEKRQTKDVQSTTQIGENVLVLAYKDKIDIVNIKDNTTVTKKVLNPELVSGAYSKQGYLITFYENIKYFKYFFVKDGKTTDINVAAVIMPDNKGGYFERATAAADNKNGYIMVEAKSAFDRYGVVKNIAFSLDGKERSVNDFKVGPYKSLTGPVNISSGDEAKFIGTVERRYEKKGTQFDIIEFTLRDGAVKDYSMASRTDEPSLYPASTGDMLIFCNNIGTNQYEIYAASKGKAFKDLNNLPRKEERSRAISDVILGFINSIILLFVYGIKWMFFGLAAVSLLSFLAHAINVRSRKILYVLSYLIAVTIKVVTIYNDSRIYEMPGLLKYPAVVIAVGLGISALCLLFGYQQYKKDTDAIPAWSYAQAVLIDSLLTQMIFIPYII